jgi:hypothetical protein
VAAPFTYLFQDSKNEILDPIIIGTQVGLMNSCLKVSDNSLPLPKLSNLE